MASLRALECLVAVADTGSITQAARLLHLSQPAISHQLAGLERETHTELLHREPRGVKLTSAGRAAVTDARRAVEAAASAVRAARAAGAATGGTLRLACAQSLTVALLAPVVRDWHRARPDVEISLRESAVAEDMYGYLESGEADVLLMPGPVSEHLTSTAVADEEIVVTAAKDHPFAQRLSVELGDLDGERLVHFAHENGLGSWLDWSLSQAGVRPEVVMRTAVTTAAPHLAAAGLGIAVTPVSAVSAGFPGMVRSFSPRWIRQLVAVTPAAPDPLTARFVAQVRARGVRVPRDVQSQLTAGDAPAR
jgi:DNA-binding transcriptional LysR family regulator